MSERMLVATRKGLFTVERAGGRWSVAGVSFLGDNVSMVLPDARDGALYAGLDHGHFGVKLHKSIDGGLTWKELAAPAFPKKPEDETDNDPMSNKPVPWTVLKIWSLEGGGRDEPGRLWCGTIPGGLFTSADGGVSWSLVESLWKHPDRKRWFGGGADWAGIHSICVDPRSSRRVAVGVSCGGVWLTEDGGRSWRVASQGMRAAYMPPEQAFDPVTQDPHRLVQCRGRPQSYWVQHHNGIFRCTDDLASWQEITQAPPSVFGFGVVVHPREPETAWFVPAVKDEKRYPADGKVVVSRTRDGGKTFDVLRAGLPQTHAYDLTFRHCLDIDESGDRLAFGSTTGSLWVSDDQGDRWQEVSSHLPPIYCVRLA